MSQPCPWIVETSLQTFEADVLERSRHVAVVLEFSAAWCKPCRQLGPVLEKLTAEYQGRFVLVKIDTERFPQMARAFRISNLPTVLGVRDGHVVDHFVGLLPEPQLRQWLDQLVSGAAKTVDQLDEAAEPSDPAAAEQDCREALRQDPHDAAALVGLARALIAQERLDEARQVIDQLGKDRSLDAEGEYVRAHLLTALDRKCVGSATQCREALDNAPEDPQRKFHLAQALAAEGRHSEAMDLCLELIQKHRQQFTECARELMVRIFHLLGPESRLANEYRRRLTMVLY